MGRVLDCQACGACCVTAGEVCVQPSDATPRHLTRSVRGAMGFASWEADEGLRRMARAENDACVSLRKSGDTWRCSIYDRRPAVCREFLPGAADCLAARAALATRDRTPAPEGE